MTDGWLPTVKKRAPLQHKLAFAIGEKGTVSQNGTNQMGENGGSNCGIRPIRPLQRQLLSRSVLFVIRLEHFKLIHWTSLIQRSHTATAHTVLDFPPNYPQRPCRFLFFADSSRAWRASRTRAAGLLKLSVELVRDALHRSGCGGYKRP